MILINSENRKMIPVELLCLMFLEERDMYCYEIIQNVELRSENRLLLNITSMYVALAHLTNNGYIEKYCIEDSTARLGQRLYYHITEAGTLYLKDLLSEYQEIRTGIDSLLCSFSKTDQ